MAQRRDFLTRLRDLVDAAAGDEVRERYVPLFDEATVRLPRASWDLFKYMRFNTPLILALLEEGEIRARMAASGKVADPQPETASTPQPLAEVEEQ